MKRSEFKKLLREEIRKVLSEAAVIDPVSKDKLKSSLAERRLKIKSGQKLDDYELTDDGYINEEDVDSWLELFTDERWNVSKYVKLANNWLKSNGYKWQVKSCSSTDDGETITWTIA